MATFSGNNEFFEIVSSVESIKERILNKKQEIEKIKLEYGIDENDIDQKTSNTKINANVDFE